MNSIQHNEHYKARGQSKRPLIVILSSVIVVVVIMALVAYYFLLNPGLPLRIISVSVSPDNPEPGDIIIVIAQVQGGSFTAPLDVDINYRSYFAGGASGGGSMIPKGSDLFEKQIGPFNNGTEIWLIVIAHTGKEVAIYGEKSVHVGTVLRSGPSELVIRDVKQFPEHPTSLDNVVITANVTSLVNITEVTLLYTRYHAYGDGTGFSSGGGGLRMEQLNGGNYSATIGLMGPPPGPGNGYSRGTTYIYRVVAIDETKNTAVTGVFSYTIV